MSGIFNSEVIDISTTGFAPSSNSGGGLELLMNAGKKTSEHGGGNSDIEIDDIMNLEAELNNLNEIQVEDAPPIVNNFNSHLFNKPANDPQSMPEYRNNNIRFNENVSIGESTANNFQDNSTWDGFNKYSDVNVPTDRQINPPISSEMAIKKKHKILRKLDDLDAAGFKSSKKYTLESNLSDMEAEADILMAEKKRKQYIKLGGNAFSMAVTGIENVVKPYEEQINVRLDGLSDQIQENIGDYDEVFGEIYDLYKDDVGTVNPVLKFLMQFGSSVVMLHMTNSMFRSCPTNADEILRQNPELMKQFQTATINSLGSTNPGFANFMNGAANIRNQGPPPPVATQTRTVNPGLYKPNEDLREPPRQQNVNMERNSVFASGPGGDDLRAKTTIDARSQALGLDDSARPEMKGPRNIDDILSGIGQTTSAPHQFQQSPPPPRPTQQQQSDIISNNSSTISINELNSLQGSANAPKKSRRRPPAGKNAVSIDI